jgi:hypothetical protein
MEGNSPLELSNLTSISGIVITTMFLIEILKRVLGNVNGFSKIPAFIYAIVISGILAFVANRLLHNPDGSPYLEGEPLKIIWAAILAALGSSGFYTWIHQPAQLEDTDKLGSKSVGNTPPSVLLLPLLGMLFLVGCQCPEKPIIVNSLDQGTKVIRKTQLEWTELLGADPEKRAKLPVLTPEQQENFRQLHKDLDATIEEYKAEGSNLSK